MTVRRAIGIVSILAIAACDGPPLGPQLAPAARPAPLPAAQGRLLGTVVDLTRQPVAGARVRLCGSPCREVATDAAGIFELRDVAKDSYGLKVELPGAGAMEVGKVVLPIYAYDPALEPTRTVPPIVLPRLGAAATLGSGAAPVAIDGTLTLTLDPAALGSPAGAVTAVAGVRVPAGLYPDFCLPSGDGRILAEWALAPFAAASSADIAIHIADGLGLPAGSGVSFLTVDPELGRPERQAAGQVSADGKSIAVTAGGIRRLTWLVVTAAGGGGP